MSERDFVMDVLRFVADEDIHGQLWWKFEEDGLHFFVNCNDMFFWGCSDCEELTPANLGILKQAFADCGERDSHADLLFVARQRGLRPQGAAYSYIPREIWPLFDAAGPEREVEFGNPCRPGEYESGRYSDKALASAAEVAI